MYQLHMGAWAGLPVGWRPHKAGTAADWGSAELCWECGGWYQVALPTPCFSLTASTSPLCPQHHPHWRIFISWFCGLNVHRMGTVWERDQGAASPHSLHLSAHTLKFLSRKKCDEDGVYLSSQPLTQIP